MLKEIVGEEFCAGQKIHVFEYGDGVFKADDGYDEESGAVRYRCNVDGQSITHYSPWCFAIREDGSYS
jgi:hypothetical protein